jgi:hypothetical protein
MKALEKGREAIRDRYLRSLFTAGSADQVPVKSPHSTINLSATMAADAKCSGAHYECCQLTRTRWEDTPHCRR